jgi:ABC-type polysaccharide/polyol phosphate transport system ATPase subunit
MTEPVISAKRISLNIPVIKTTNQSLLSNPLAVIGEFYSLNQRREFRQIIRGISFEARAGDRIALIGVNGAGKTTLLRMLAGVIRPTDGELHVHGETQALLNVAMGMQQEATGLENIYLNGLAMGLSLEEIRNAIPEIVTFSELGDAIRDPVRTYSAGMRLRLAFSVATTTRPEILLLDEWLNAGDQFFIDKAKQRLMSQVQSTKVLVLATHSAQTVRDVCNRTFVLKNGRILFDGDVEGALAYYGSKDYLNDEPYNPSAKSRPVEPAQAPSLTLSN